MSTTQIVSPQQIFQRLVAPYGVQPSIANEIYGRTRASYGALGATTADLLRSKARQQFEQQNQ